MRSIPDVIGSQPFRHFHARLEEVGRTNRSDAEPAGKRRKQQADGSLTQDQHRFIALDAQFVKRFQTSVDRLDETGALERHRIGDPNHAALNDPIHDAHVLRKPTTGRLETGSDAHFLVLGALGVVPVLAIEAIETWNVVEQADAITFGKPGDFITDANDSAGRLMSVDSRRRQEIMLDFLEVRMADAAGFNAYKDFAGTGLWNGNLLKGDSLLSRVYCCPHHRCCGYVAAIG